MKAKTKTTDAAEVPAPVPAKLPKAKLPATKVLAAKAPKTALKSTPVAAKRSPRKKSAATSSPGEIILIAQVDVGLGNTLYFRGWGGGLRWDAGTPAVCEGENRWVLKLTEVAEPVHFKVLINDDLWSAGPDLTATPSAAVEFNPSWPS